MATIISTLGEAGMTVNTPVQTVANNPNVPAPVANVAALMGNSVVYACGPTSYLVLAFFGINPETPLP